DSTTLPSYLIGQNTCAVYATTTKPECDAHLVKGSATTRARVRSAHRRHHRRHRRAARRRAGTPEAAATPTEEHRRRPVVPGPAGALRDTVTGELGKLATTAGPLPVDTRVRVRPKSVIGLKYLELEPGRSRTTLKSGATIPLRNQRSSVDLQDALNAFDAATRRATRSVTVELGDGFA